MKQLAKPAWPAVLGMTVAAMLAFPAERVSAGDMPYVGDIISVAYNYCPAGWMKAEGQILPINSYMALFALYGTTYGGNGSQTFGLPDLRSRTASGQGYGPGLTPRPMGVQAGRQAWTLTISELPSHTHMVNANNLDGNFAGPGGKLLAAAPTGGTGNETIYSGHSADAVMSPQMITPTGGGQALNTQDPYLAMQYCVAVEGIFPPRS